LGGPATLMRRRRTIGAKSELLCAEHSATVGECHAATDALALVEDLASSPLVARQPILADGDNDVDLPMSDGGEEAVEAGTTAAEAAHSFITVDVIGHDRPAVILCKRTQPFDFALLPSSCELSTR